MTRRALLTQLLVRYCSERELVDYLRERTPFLKTFLAESVVDFTGDVEAEINSFDERDIFAVETEEDKAALEQEDAARLSCELIGKEKS